MAEDPGHSLPVLSQSVLFDEKALLDLQVAQQQEETFRLHAKTESLSRHVFCAERIAENSTQFQF